MRSGLRRWWQILAGSRSETLGARGERLAADFLRQQGLRILHRNYRNRLGEIDLIAQQQGTWVFVEVRSRKTAQHGDPAETITQTKQRRLTRAALAFLKSQHSLNVPARFDVVIIVWGEAGEKPTLRHLPNAFSATE